MNRLTVIISAILVILLPLLYLVARENNFIKYLEIRNDSLNPITVDVGPTKSEIGRFTIAAGETGEYHNENNIPFREMSVTVSDGGASKTFTVSIGFLKQLRATYAYKDHDLRRQ